MYTVGVSHGFTIEMIRLETSVFSHNNGVSLVFFH